MACYIGLDVSQRRTAICIIDADGGIVAEGRALTSPAEIYAWLAGQADVTLIRKVRIKAGAMSFWLHTGLSELGSPMLCLEAYQAAHLLKTHRLNDRVKYADWLYARLESGWIADFRLAARCSDGRKH